MATTAPEQLPPAAERQTNFEQAVAYALHLWPALTLSVQNQWGGPDSADKRDWFAGAIVELFPEFTDAAPGQSTRQNAQEPDLEDVETVLLQVMLDEFQVNVDDDSAVEVAQQIIRARAQGALGQMDEFNTLRERFMNRKGTKVEGLFRQVEDTNQDTEWESDDSGDEDEDDEDGGADVAMEDAPAPSKKAEPEVDEDGFTKVTRKR